MAGLPLTTQKLKAVDVIPDTKPLFGLAEKLLGVRDKHSGTIFFSFLCGKFHFLRE